MNTEIEIKNELIKFALNVLKIINKICTKCIDIMNEIFLTWIVRETLHCKSFSFEMINYS